MKAIKKRYSKVSERVKKAALATLDLEQLGLKIDSIKMSPERVCMNLKNNSFHPKLRGIFRGTISDVTGKWCIYETTIHGVLVRWLVEPNRRPADELQA